MFCEETQLVVKHTYIELQCDEHKSQMRRNSSAPSMACFVKSCTSDSETSEYECASKCPEAMTPTTCASENGDENDDLPSLPDDASLTEGALCFREVKSVVKNTFVEFKPLEEEKRPSLRRIKSEPLLANLDTGDIRFMEADSPTPSTSVRDDCDCESMGSLRRERIINWADCDARELDDDVTEEVSQGDKDGLRKRRGGRVRSGRARQREARRRRMRTPSPEMRSYF